VYCFIWLFADASFSYLPCTIGALLSLDACLIYSGVRNVVVLATREVRPLISDGNACCRWDWD
jgi:hypothetical protein